MGPSFLLALLKITLPVKEASFNLGAAFCHDSLKESAVYFDLEGFFTAGLDLIDTTSVRKNSHCLKVLQPELGLLATPTKAVMPSTVIKTSQRTVVYALPLVLCFVILFRCVKSFCDRREGAEDWLYSFNRVLVFN